MAFAERSPAILAVMAALILAETLWRLQSRRGYDGRTALATLGLMLGNMPFAALNALLLGAVFGTLWSITPLRLPLDRGVTWVAGFLCVEFAYYWFHRASHRIRWMWATHSVHHSAGQLTLLSSFRLGWTNLLSAGWIFYAPLVLAGFHPVLVFGLLAFNLRYQFFLHTEAVGRLGPIEWIFNTPAHHRLHHASNDVYLDRNYGGVLIIFDRLFGTLAVDQPGEAPRYGLAHRKPSHNPIALALGEWRSMVHDAIRARDWRGVLRALFAPPGKERGDPA